MDKNKLLSTFKSKLIQFVDGNIENVWDCVLAIFLWGSQVYKTATAKSDWDIVMIVTNESDEAFIKKYPPTNNEINGALHTVVEFDEFNVAIISREKFECMLYEYRQQALQCVLAEETNKWYQRVKFEKPATIDYALLRRTIFWESKMRISTARNKWMRQDFQAAKKEFVHSIRYLIFALQIVESGTIIDFSAVNSIWECVLKISETTDWPIFNESWHLACTKFKQILSVTISSWPNKIDKNDFAAIVRDVLKILTREDLVKVDRGKKTHQKQILGDFCIDKNFYLESETARLAIRTIRKRVALSTFQLPKVHSQFETTASDFVNNFLLSIFANGLEKFCEANKNISTIPHQTYSDVILFTCFPFAPRSTNMEKQIKHLIIDFRGLKIVSFFPQLSYWNANTSHENATLCDLIDGLRVHLFFLRGQWELASKWEPNAPQHLVAYHTFGKKGKNVVTLEQLFWNIWKKLGYNFPETENLCFTFYLTTGKHRQVVDVREDKILLVDCYEIPSLRQISVEYIAAKNGWECCSWRKCDSSNLWSRIKDNHSQNPFYHKGYLIHYESGEKFILYNNNFVSAKLGLEMDKYSSLFLHHHELTHIEILQLCVRNQFKLFSEFFPQVLSDEHISIFHQFDNFCDVANKEYVTVVNQMNDKTDAKQFSERIKQFSFGKHTFYMFKGFQKEIRETFADIDLQVVRSLLLEPMIARKK